MAASERIRLPPPRLSGLFSLEEILLARRSRRTFGREPLTAEEIAQLLWAAQGVTHPNGYRTAPSAGALFPLELYAAVGDAVGLPVGLYRYEPAPHALARRKAEDLRPAFCRAALDQRPVARAPVVFLLAAVFGRTSARYGERGVRYAILEAGHAAQNLCLQAAALDLQSVLIGAFRDREIRELAGLPEGEEPLYLVPVGK